MGIIGCESLKGWISPIKASITNKIEHWILETMNIFFSSIAASRIFKMLSTDNNLKRQYMAFIETLFSDYFLGKLVITPHHLNSKVWFFSLGIGIDFLWSSRFLLYFFRRDLPKTCKLEIKSLAKKSKSFGFFYPFLFGKYSIPFWGEMKERRARYRFYRILWKISVFWIFEIRQKAF